MKNIVENQDIKTDKAEIEGLHNQLAAVVAERDAMAAENAYLKDVSNWDFKTGASEFECTSNQGFDDDDCMHDAVLMMLEKFKTPATAAAIAAIEARGVEKLADFCSTANNGNEIHPDIEEIRMFAAELREHSQGVEQ
ncbi:hypothetical protein I6G37_09855 [Serratia rubidaea]|nr:hypothetical protein I6G37_09855 [Serratia rubidaea]